MEEELNYLSKRIERLDRHIEYYEIERERVGTGFVYSGEKRVKKEKKILEHIINYITIEELTS